MACESETFFDQWPKKMNRLNSEAPDIPRAFGTLFQSLMKAGALTVREKELIALGIGIAVRCVPCINAHTEKAMQAGATKEQVLEAAGVAVMMQGGPSFTYVPQVVDALDVLEKQLAPK
jgi:AhpD family alkylhydroperoxidase